MNKDLGVERVRVMVRAKSPFLHKGRDPVNGIDCVGALAHAFQYSGHIPDYPPNPVNGELERNLNLIFGPPLFSRSPTDPPFEDTQLQQLDILALQYAGPARHVATVVNHIAIPGVLSLIHTDAMVGRVVEHILDLKWRRRILKVWRP